ncbi:MAG: DUF2242 domain-containing protein [Halothiobacillaceae bacterium]
MLRYPFALVLVASLSACATPKTNSAVNPVAERPFQKDFVEDSVTSCKAAHRALLGDGYLVETLSAEQLKGRKSFRTNSEQGSVVDMTISCLANNDGTSTVYANGLRTAYEMKKSSTSASVGVSVFGSLSVPIGQSADSMVKTTDETISEPAFYRAFFKSMSNILEETRSERTTK